ncbi:MAG: helix-turn-helix domain-containing protein [Verrucomicrobiales bacterium]|nr:helix-turn-helix domain-containing protein [Verrucomicrobiales bacterium]
MWKALHLTEKPLSRACQKIRGLSPKKLMDRDFALEAKRKLIIGDVTVEGIAFDPGFSEATDLVKSLNQIVGELPERVRSRQRALRA